jgi:hypothetical protein
MANGLRIALTTPDRNLLTTPTGVGAAVDSGVRSVDIVTGAGDVDAIVCVAFRAGAGASSTGSATMVAVRASAWSSSERDDLAGAVFVWIDVMDAGSDCFEDFRPLGASSSSFGGGTVSLASASELSSALVSASSVSFVVASEALSLSSDVAGESDDGDELGFNEAGSALDESCEVVEPGDPPTSSAHAGALESPVSRAAPTPMATARPPTRPTSAALGMRYS